MNEYRWYNDDFMHKCHKKNMQKTSNTENTSSNVVLIAIIISVICSIITGIILYSIIFTGKNSIKTKAENPNLPDFSDQQETYDENDVQMRPQTETIMKSVVEVSVEATGGFINRAVTVCTGNGVVLTANGYILTTEYIREVDGDIFVEFNDGQRYQAEVAGSDSEKYIAVLKVERDDCEPASIGNSSDIEIGEKIYAVCNKVSSNFSNPITSGIICGYDADVTLKDGSSINVFQTDASNIVNSIGGLIYNKYGQLIGISTAKFTVSNNDIGFFTPIDDTKDIIKSIIEDTDIPKSFNIGISGSDAQYGVTVDNVVKGSAAEKAGLKYGDLIMKINGTTVSSLSEINKIKKELSAGDKMIFLVYRSGETLEIELIVE